MLMRRRYLVGSLLACLGVGGALALDLIGPVAPPEPLVLQFGRGTSLAQGEAARLDAFVGRHIAEPRVMFHVLGHTGERGEAAANLALSQERAALVATRLEGAGVPEDRILSVSGVGAADPLAPEPGEARDGAYQRRLARVVVTAVVEK